MNSLLAAAHKLRLSRKPAAPASSATQETSKSKPISAPSSGSASAPSAAAAEWKCLECTAVVPDYLGSTQCPFCDTKRGEKLSGGKPADPTPQSITRPTLATMPSSRAAHVDPPSPPDAHEPLFPSLHPPLRRPFSESDADSRRERLIYDDDARFGLFDGYADEDQQLLEEATMLSLLQLEHEASHAQSQSPSQPHRQQQPHAHQAQAHALAPGGPPAQPPLLRSNSEGSPVGWRCTNSKCGKLVPAELHVVHVCPHCDTERDDSWQCSSCTFINRVSAKNKAKVPYCAPASICV